MTDRPILFSGPMVRALLEGRKTQTRRILKPQPSDYLPVAGAEFVDDRWCWLDGFDGSILETFKAPFKIGDRLWIREAYQLPAILNTTPPRKVSSMSPVRYPANEGRDTGEDGDGNPIKLRPGIHMPRWASRLTLIITDVRVQRLQGISYDDLIAEGIQSTEIFERREEDCIERNIGCGRVSRDAFKELWNRINGPDAWDANPWVTATTFTVHKVNIDQMKEAA